MRILVLNSGSSSLKFSIYDSGPLGQADDPNCLYDGEVTGLGTPSAQLTLRAHDAQPLPASSSNVNATAPADAFDVILKALRALGALDVEAVGYRVVHSGPKLDTHQRLTPEVLTQLEDATAFAPLHNPADIAVIRKGMTSFPGIDHYACFDTVFHRTMPEEAAIYPIPKSFRDQGIRRYGFHGLSCESVVRQLASQPGACPERMIIAHLGSGCSVTALLHGRSIDTSMGLTPTGGVVMGTRPGDLDPGLVLYLLRSQTADRNDAVSALENLLNHDSGLVALSELPNDMRSLRKAAFDGNAQAAISLKVFTRAVTKAVGAFCWLLGGLDAIVFTGGIGEHDARTRSDVLEHVQEGRILLSSQQNEHPGTGDFRISAPESSVAVLVVPAQEDLMIAVHVARMAQSESPASDSPSYPA